MKRTLLSIDSRLERFAANYKAEIIKDRFKNEWGIPRDWELREVNWVSGEIGYSMTIGQGSFSVWIGKDVNGKMLGVYKVFLEPGATTNFLIKNFDDLLEQAKQFIMQVTEKDFKEIV